ncbi:hypothetical protein [Bradyrhizobium sp. SYSU BS000235]|uniref:hypothetical protein n=1 Tax=Bradyrhizobium sp. SYSU BS000235 TaxID=3411332 RepID=UPI003C742F26
MSLSAWWDYLRHWLGPEPDTIPDHSHDGEDRSTMADLARLLDEEDARTPS